MLYRGGRRFDPWALDWAGEEALPDDAVPVTPAEALRLLHQSGGVRRVPVAVIGPKAASEAQCAIAEALGRRLAELGVTVLCGGRGGVMEAVSKGCLESGGLAIGLLPDEEWTAANPYVAIPLASGLGPARNAVIARAAPVLIAIGGEYGTLSEMAFGLHFNRLVLALADAPEVRGAVRCGSVEEAVEKAAARMLRIA
jgi:uncharacterized protein (TIGR00725 family)